MVSSTGGFVFLELGITKLTPPSALGEPAGNRTSDPRKSFLLPAL